MAAKTETEIIREECKRARDCARALVAHPLPTQADAALLVYSLGDALELIDRANEARDKSRTLSLDVSLYDFTKHMVEALLSQGFELALAAVVPQLKTVKIDGRTTTWVPPENPFRTPARDFPEDEQDRARADQVDPYLRHAVYAPPVPNPPPGPSWPKEPPTRLVALSNKVDANFATLADTMQSFRPDRDAGKRALDFLERERDAGRCTCGTTVPCGVEGHS